MQRVVEYLRVASQASMVSSKRQGLSGGQQLHRRERLLR
jgi:hypothetical protein